MKWIYLMTGCALCGCSTIAHKPAEPPLVAGDAHAPSQITPREAMEIAQQLATHPWRPFAANILHGKDSQSVLVNTPDIGHEPNGPRQGWWIPGNVNEGIPYKWGGYDGPDTFDAAIANGLAAGDVSSPAKRAADNAAVSTRAAGLDCSGFVSKCLKLPSVHDTAKLPSVCDELSNSADLRPGDVLNIPRRHVVLCAGWANPEKTWIHYYETGGGPQYWKPALKQAPLDKLIALGYKPLRYRGMARATLPQGQSAKDVLTRAIKATAIAVPEPTVGEP